MIRIDTIKETMKSAGFGWKFKLKKQITQMENELAMNEKLLGVITSAPKPTEQLYVTDRRVIVHTMDELPTSNKINIPLSSIATVHTTNTKNDATIEVVASHFKKKIDNVPPKQSEAIKEQIESLIL